MTLNRQLNDAKDDLKNKEREFRVTVQKLTDDEKQRSCNDKLLIDGLKDKVQELEQKVYKTEIRAKKDTERLEESNDKYDREVKLLAEENKALKSKVIDLQNEVELYKKTNNEGKR